jgi:hypothetical protein
MHGIDNPAKQLFAGCPVCVALPEFLDGVWGLPVAVVCVIGAEEKIQGVEDVTAGLLELTGRALSKRKKVVDEDVNVGQRRPEGPVRRGWGGGRVIGRRGGCGVRGEAFQGVCRGEVGETPGVVNQVGGRFCGSTEKRRRLDVAHGQREVKPNERFRVARMRRNHEGELWQVRDVEPYPHICVREIHFCHVHRPVSRVGIHDGVEEAVQGAPKLHRFWRSLLADGPVGAAPGVVVDQPGAAPRLGNAANRTETQCGEQLGLTPRQDADVAVGDLLGELAADEVGGN